MGRGGRHQHNMSGEENFEIETTDAGASATVGVEAGSIRKGGYIMIKGKACKVRDVSTSKTGKHGHAKCKFQAVDIFSGATCEELCPSSHNIDVPVVTKKDYQIQGLEVSDRTYLVLMDEGGEMREDMMLPTDAGFNTADDVKASQMIKDLMEQIDGGAEIDAFCTVLSAIGIEKVVDIRKKTDLSWWRGNRRLLHSAQCHWN